MIQQPPRSTLTNTLFPYTTLFRSICASEMISHGRFDGVAIYPPPGPIRSFVFVLSSAQGWRAPEIWMAAQLNARGALVAGIDTANLYAGFEKADDDCLFADGDFENLSRFKIGRAHV